MLHRLTNPLKILLTTAVCFLLISCKEQTADIGNLAPELATFDLQGNQITLAQFQGKPILLTFWSENCGICIKELKEFEQLNQQYPNQLHLVAINIDGEKADTQAVVNQRKIGLTVLKDQLKITGERYAVIGSPTSFFIDLEGKIRYKFESLIPKDQLQSLFTQGTL